MNVPWPPQRKKFHKGIENDYHYIVFTPISDAEDAPIEDIHDLPAAEEEATTADAPVAEVEEIIALPDPVPMVCSVFNS